MGRVLIGVFVYSFYLKSKMVLIRINMDLGVVVNGLVGWLEVWREKFWKIRDKEVLERRMWMDF